LGYLFEEGLGTNVDLREAVRLYGEAADKGDAVAMRFLGINYWEGIGVPIDRQESRRWFRKATEAGDGEAEKVLEELQSAASAATAVV
jgi:TPR repeat protein